MGYIKKLTRKSDVRVEDKCLVYTDRHGSEHYYELTEDQFALFELGFKDGHDAGVNYAMRMLEGNYTPLTYKQLEQTYG